MINECEITVLHPFIFLSTCSPMSHITRKKGFRWLHYMNVLIFIYLTLQQICIRFHRLIAKSECEISLLHPFIVYQFAFHKPLRLSIHMCHIKTHICHVTTNALSIPVNFQFSVGHAHGRRQLGRKWVQKKLISNEIRFLSWDPWISTFEAALALPFSPFSRELTVNLVLEIPIRIWLFGFSTFL